MTAHPTRFLMNITNKTCPYLGVTSAQFKAEKMTRKGAGAASAAKKAMDKIVHPPYLETYIRAGKATPSPPLGPQLGSRNIQIGAFCKDFNEQTKNIKPGTPLPTRIHVNPDKTYRLVIHAPPVSWFLCNAAGIKKGAAKPKKEIAGKVSMKHVYEIAKIKIQDPSWDTYSLQDVCISIIGTAHSCGIEVVKHDLDPVEYGAFLEERRRIVDEQENKLIEAKQAKLLRYA